MKSAVLKLKLVNVILEMTSYIRLDFRKLGIHKKHSFSLRFYLASVEVLQTDTLVSGQLYLRPYSQNPVSLNSQTQTLYFYIPVSSQLQLQTPFFESRGCPLMRASMYLNYGQYKPVHSVAELEPRAKIGLKKGP